MQALSSHSCFVDYHLNKLFNNASCGMFWQQGFAILEKQEDKFSAKENFDKLLCKLS